jgi:hypothetical protein
MSNIDPETGMAKERKVDIIGGSEVSDGIPSLEDEDMEEERGEQESSMGSAGAGPEEEEEEGIPPTPPPRVRKYKCRYCGAEFTSPLDLGRHMRKEHHTEMALEKAAQKGIKIPRTAAPPTTGEGEEGVSTTPAPRERTMTDDEIFAEIRIRGQAALEEQLRARLEQLLSMPSVSKESRDYVMREWDNDPSIHLDFQALFGILFDAGVKPDKSQRIVDRLVMFYNKFAPALQAPPMMSPHAMVNQGDQYQYPNPYSYQQGGPQQPSPYQYGQYQLGPYPGRQNPWQQGPYPYMQYQYGPGGPGYPYAYQYPPPPPQPGSPGGGLTEESVRKIVEDVLSKLNPKQQEKEKEDDEMEADVPIAYAKDGTPIMGKVRGNPAAVVGMIIASGSSRGQTPDESVSDAMKAMQEQLDRLQDKLSEAEKRADEAEKRRLEDSIKRLEDQMAKMESTYREQLEKREEEIEDLRSNMPRGEYKSDAYRFIDSAASKLENIMKDRRPLEKFVEVLKPPQPGQPTSDQVALDELKKLGLTMES